MKPQPKQELAVDFYHEPSCSINFYAAPDAIDDIRQFGQITPEYRGTPNLYHLSVDRRYDFQEVLEYLQNYRRQR